MGNRSKKVVSKHAITKVIVSIDTTNEKGEIMRDIHIYVYELAACASSTHPDQAPLALSRSPAEK